MNLIESILVGLRQLKANKLRSLLSLTGILIAIGSVTGIVSIGEGLRETVVGEFDKIGGSTMIWSWAPERWVRKGNRRVRRNWEEHITYRDLASIKNETDEIEFITPTRWVGGPDWEIRYRSVSVNPSVICSDQYYAMVQNWDIAKGRFLNASDMMNYSKVCVLGHKTAEDLFPKGVNPLEKEVRVGSARYTVVGVMDSKKFLGNNMDNNVVIPITTVQRRYFGNDHIQVLFIKVKKPEYAEKVAEAIRRVYRRIHEHGDEFGIKTGSAALEEINKIILILKVVVGGVAGISLIVGGIGIMNIMLVSITERTREIGIRMALGARKSDILWQFIIESIVLCLIGGIMGIFLGLVLGWGIAEYVSSLTSTVFKSVLSIKMMLIAVGFSVTVGLVFGVYPAWRASNFEPVEALRQE